MDGFSIIPTGGIAEGPLGLLMALGTLSLVLHYLGLTRIIIFSSLFRLERDYEEESCNLNNIVVNLKNLCATNGGTFDWVWLCSWQPSGHG
jgi:hypothetical protein